MNRESDRIATYLTIHSPIKRIVILLQINRICTDRGVFFTYVDLRWGITSEQTSDGKTIAICLQEVRLHEEDSSLLQTRLGFPLFLPN